MRLNKSLGESDIRPFELYKVDEKNIDNELDDELDNKTQMGTILFYISSVIIKTV